MPAVAPSWIPRAPRHNSAPRSPPSALWTPREPSWGGSTRARFRAAFAGARAKNAAPLARYQQGVFRAPEAPGAPFGTRAGPRGGRDDVGGGAGGSHTAAQLARLRFQSG